MSTPLSFNAELRESRGKADSRRLRRQADRVPAIVYGAGKENQQLTLPHKDVMITLSHEAVYSQILTLNIGGTPEKVVLKDLQRHPVKNRVLHLDFLRINLNEKLRMHVPLHFMGEDKNVAITKEGGVIAHLMNEVEVKCLPANLPEYIEVDVSALGMDEGVHLSQLRLPEGVEFAHAIDEDHDQTVANIHMPRAAKEDVESEAAPSVEGAEGAEAAAVPTAEEEKEKKE